MKNARYLFTLLFCFGPAAHSSAQQQEAVDPAVSLLLQNMHGRYADTWYETFTFVQQTVQHRPGGRVDTTTWYEAMRVPGQLRIDYAPIEAGNGLLFREDTLHIFQGGARANMQPRVHPLLLLGFDVYRIPVSETIGKLRGLGIDLTTMHEATWQGRPAYVVGAAEGDTTSAQFWIDQERLYFVRMLQPAGPNGNVIQETQFNKYVEMGGGWVAPEVLFFANGRLALEEYYSDMKTGVALDDAIFDQNQWTSAPHWYNQ